MRRRLQFTLRFLLVEMAALGVLLGVFVNMFQRQLRFAAAIRALDGQVIYDDHRFDAGTLRGWLRSWLGDDMVLSIETVALGSLDDGDLAVFDDARNLRGLVIGDARLTKAGVARVAQLKCLGWLRIKSTCMTISDLVLRPT